MLNLLFKSPCLRMRPRKSLFLKGGMYCKGIAKVLEVDTFVANPKETVII